MSGKFETRLSGTIALPLCLMLAACGGDGSTSVASIPPPPPPPAPTPTSSPIPAPTSTPTPTPTSAQTSTPTLAPAKNAFPLTSAGNYDLIGRLTIDPGTGNPGDWTNRTILPGEFTMTVTDTPAAELKYSLTAPAGILPGGLTSVTSGQLLGWSINSNGYTRGGSAEALPFGAGTNLGTGVYLDPGYSYVSMGAWEWPEILSGNSTNATNFGQLLFVNGDRTPPSGIPASGTAIYDAHSLQLQSSSGALGIPFTLTADFGLRTIATRIDQDFRNSGGPGSDPMDYTPIQGIHVGGSAPFSSNGTFDIPLSGTVNFAYEYVPSIPPSQAAIGDMNGAFFGPHAEQVGGTFSIQRTTDQLPLYQDAFVGKQH